MDQYVRGEKRAEAVAGSRGIAEAGEEYRGGSEGVGQSVEDTDVCVERADVLFHGGEESCDVWIFARNNAEGSGGAAGRNGKEFAARKVADGGGSQEAGVEGIDRRSGEVE